MVNGMYYRYVGRRLNGTDTSLKGIFEIFTPDERRKWGSCLATPKWYSKHPDVETEAWFTQHGYDKWHGKMDAIINDFLDAYGRNNYEISLLRVETLNNIVSKGKTQCIVRV